MLNLQNKLCIFDCDGTLVDTEPLVAKSWVIFFKKYFNVNITEEDYFKYCHGKTPEDMCEHFNRKFNINLKFEGEIQEKKRIITQDLIRNELRPIASVSEFLRNVEEVRKCIASNSSKKKILISIKTAGLDKYFDEDEIFSRDLVDSGIIKSAKPAPDIYLYTAEQMEYKPENCVVFEDSVTGVQAGKAANMIVVGCITPSYQDKVKMRKKMEAAGAHYIVEDMTELLK
jgi:HAD superfamily hydrolase (TIGR01509 family)